MPARRSRGDGGLHWDAARQRWIATASLGYDPSGKRVIKRGSGKTKTEAKAKLKEVLRDYEDGLAIAPDGYTVAQAVTDWLAHGLNGRDRDTIITCTILCQTHIIPALGARKLRDLRAEDVDKWLAAKARTLSTAAPGGDVPRTGAVASPGPQYRDDDIAGDPGAGAAGGGLRLVVSRTRPPGFVQRLADRTGAALLPLGSAGAKAAAVICGEADAYVHSGGQYEWDSAAPVAVARAAGLHASRIDGSKLAYNQASPSVPDILICRAALADLLLGAISSVRRPDE